MKTLNKAILVLMSTGLVTTAVSAKSYYDHARVIYAKPIVEYVTVSAPVHQCHTREYRRPARHNHGGALVGAVVGGVIGHAIGDNDASTIAGAIIGGSIGHSASHQTVRRVNDCHSRYEERKKIRKITGYNVKYRYKGHVYHDVVNQHPGDTIKVRVRVRPAGYN